MADQEGSSEHRPQKRSVSPQVSMREHLSLSREEIPHWLKAFDRGRPFPREAFFRSRVVYYPGSGSDGHPVKVFGASHAAHVIVYADYAATRESMVARLEDPSTGFSGYQLGARVPVCGRDLFDGWRQPHFDANEGQPSTRLEATADACGFLQVLDRDADLDDQHGPSRLAILFLFADGITAYDALFCQDRDRRAPFAVLLQDHGFGGNYDRFGQGGLLDRIAGRASVYPEYLLIAKYTDAWEGCSLIPDVPGEMGGMTPTLRRLWRR